MLERLGVGEQVYVGAFVTAEVARRGLPKDAASEKDVRQCLRHERGMDALAREALPTIKGILGAGRAALVDAIYNKEERDLYEETFGDRLVLIAVQTSFENRLERLRTRPDRSLDRKALEARDGYEINQLRLAELIASAHHLVENDCSLHSLEKALEVLTSKFGLGGGTLALPEIG